MGAMVSSAALEPAADPRASLRLLLLARQRETAGLRAALEAVSSVVAIECVDSAAQARTALMASEWDAVLAIWPSAAAEMLEEMPVALPRILVTQGLSDDALRAAQRSGAFLCTTDRCAEQLITLLRQVGRMSMVQRRTSEREEFDAEQVRILELVATNSPLEQVLERIVLMIERRSAGHCSILLLDGKTRCVRHGAAPSLPPQFVAAIDGLPIGPNAGSCGAAAYSGESVFVRDIESHRNWDGYRELALPHGLRACWSTPILSPEREVLGTFAVYYQEPRDPRPEELRRVASATHLAAIAIMRKRHESALHMSELRQRQLLETSYEGVLVLDLDASITFANRRAAAMLAATSDALVGRNVYDFLHDSERDRVRALLDSHRQGHSEQYELRMRTAAGEDLWCIVGTSPVFGESGEVVGMLEMLTDITERRRAEQARDQSELELRSIFENTSMGVVLVDTKAVPIRFNSALTRILGYEPDELAGMSLLTLANSEDLSAILERNEQERAGGQFELRLIRKDGEAVWVRINATPVASDAATSLTAVLLVEDISESKRLAEALRSEELLLALLYQSVTDIICYLAVERGEHYRIVSVNRAFCAAVGVSSQQVLGKRLDELGHLLPLGTHVVHFREAVQGARTVYWEDVVRLPSGNEQIELCATPVFDSARGCTNLIVTSRLITERKRAQAKIAEQAALLDRARDAIILYGLDHVISYWNQAAVRLYGYSREEAIGASLKSLLHRDPSAFESAERRLHECGSFMGELVQHDKAGHELCVDSSFTLLRDADGKPESVLVINSDATEKKKLQAQVLLAQRMESLGTLAGGIAHDFNNILAAIRGYLELASARLPPKNPAQESLAIVRVATDRAVELVQRILTFSHHRPVQREPCLLKPVVEEVLRLLRATLPRMLEIEVDYAEGAFAVLADPTQIHQIVMNLGTNAAQALGMDGRIVVRLAPVVLHDPLVGIATEVPAGSYMRLSFSDNGCGMDEETLARIFDPFFTTKAPGIGTGLGLSVVLGIVKEHCGALRVSSAIGRGTQFEIYLPEAVPKRPSTRPPPSTDPPRGRGERVLCVDDEEWLINLEKTFLEGIGYAVECYASPTEALAVFTENPERFSAVVTDLAMAEMSGIELARAVHRVRADVPILMCSGHLPHSQRKLARNAGVKAIVAKPDFLTPLAHELSRLLTGCTRSLRPVAT